MSAEIPAGWYPNPWNDAEELYWSGAEWTGISRAVHRTAPAGGMPGGTPAQASQIEDSTVMRPVGAPASSSFAPRGASVPSFEQPSAPAPLFAASQGQGTTPPYAEPQYTAPQYGAPQHTTPQFAVSEYEQQSCPAQQQHYPAQPTADQPYSTATYPTEPFSPTPYLAQPNPAYGTDPAAAHDPTDAASIRWALGDSAPAGSTVNPRAKFGLVAMILGIVAAVFAIIPGLSFAAWIPAFVAITLGILAYVAGRPRTFALVGIITGGAALAVGTGVSLWFVAQLGVLGH